MERLPLTTVLTSVLSAAMENTNRPALLAMLLPELRPARAEDDWARTIPLPRRDPEQLAGAHDPAPAV